MTTGNADLALDIEGKNIPHHTTLESHHSTSEQKDDFHVIENGRLKAKIRSLENEKAKLEGRVGLLTDELRETEENKSKV